MDVTSVPSKVRLIELFAGIGSQAKAFSNLGVPYSVEGICEIDKFAIKSYAAIHGETRNFGDISKVETLPHADIWTYSFPCTDVSTIGKREGFGKDSGTRSGLVWEVGRLLRRSEKPKVLLMENVKNLIGKRFYEGFQEWVSTLEELGYNSYHKVINSTDHGVPQNRERVFMVSIHKSVDDGKYQFPTERDFLPKIDTLLLGEGECSKYILPPDKVDKYVQKSLRYLTYTHGVGHIYTPLDLDRKVISAIVGRDNMDGCHIVETRSDEGIRFFKDNNCGTLRTINSCGDKRVIHPSGTMRKLTPLESWRLMGFDDKDFNSAAMHCGDSQLWKQAGNSIVVPVLEDIFTTLLPYLGGDYEYKLQRSEEDKGE